MAESTDRPPEVGELAYDERRGLGHVVEIGRSRIYLRPPGGGLEWEAPAARVRRASASEVLAAAMRARGLLSTPTPGDGETFYCVTHRGSAPIEQRQPLYTAAQGPGLDSPAYVCTPCVLTGDAAAAAVRGTTTGQDGAP